MLHGRRDYFGGRLKDSSGYLNAREGSAWDDWYNEGYDTKDPILSVGDYVSSPYGVAYVAKVHKGIEGGMNKYRLRDCGHDSRMWDMGDGMSEYVNEISLVAI